MHSWQPDELWVRWQEDMGIIPSYLHLSCVIPVVHLDNFARLYSALLVFSCCTLSWDIQYLVRSKCFLQNVLQDEWNHVSHGLHFPSELRRRATVMTGPWTNCWQSFTWGFQLVYALPINVVSATESWCSVSPKALTRGKSFAELCFESWSY